MKDDEAKNRMDALELLRKSAMERYTWRAEVEWKLCFALWAALAAFSGAVLTGKEVVPLKMPAALIGTVTVALGVCILHLSWVWGLRRAQKIDNDISFFFRDHMMSAASLQFPPDILEEIKNMRRMNRSIWTHWNYRFQLFTTVLLACGSIAAIWWAANRSEHEQRPSVENGIELTIGQNKLLYKIPAGKNIKIILDKDGKLDFQNVSLGADNVTKP